jgi:hypothetical protein
MITQQIKISASPDVWGKLERFFALLHFNASHSATCGINFDGDGADCFKIEPAPSPLLRRAAQRIGDGGGGLEIANEDSYVGRSVVGLPFYILRGTPGDELVRVSIALDGSEAEKVVRRYDR